MNLICVLVVTVLNQIHLRGHGTLKEQLQQQFSVGQTLQPAPSLSSCTEAGRAAGCVVGRVLVLCSPLKPIRPLEKNVCLEYTNGASLVPGLVVLVLWPFTHTLHNFVHCYAFCTFPLGVLRMFI